WMIASGSVAHRGDYHASFLIDPKGDFRRMGPMWWGAASSRDGRTIAWARPLNVLRPNQVEIYTLDLTQPKAEPVATGITYRNGGFVVSDDGRRVALREGGNLSIHELATHRLLFSGRVFADRSRTFFFFVTPDVVRVL